MKVTIFSATHCPACRKAKEYFEEKGVSFIERNVESDMEAQEEIVGRGFMSVPVIKIDNEYINGFNPRKLEEFLDN